MLELRHVGFETDDNKEILRDVSLTVQDRFVAITGPNGGGKSTLAKVIAGIYQPTSGQILLDGVDITHMSITDRANLGLSYAFQQPVRFKGLRVYPQPLCLFRTGVFGRTRKNAWLPGLRLAMRRAR